MRSPYSVRPVFAWYDLWVGVFIDRPKRRIYVFPLPCLGFVIQRRLRGEFVRRDSVIVDGWPDGKPTGRRYALPVVHEQSAAANGSDL